MEKSKSPPLLSSLPPFCFSSSLCDSPPSPLLQKSPQEQLNLSQNPTNMVSPSVPLYLDPPNWNQQQVHQSAGSGGAGPAAAAAAAPLRPNSMAERARLAKIPQPEPALKCPRCESTNTKFCYFNNYSLSQPRHFCKACRRYWTHGGALRSVPVGGGCRRNKRSSAAKSSKPSAAIANPPLAAPAPPVQFFSHAATDYVPPPNIGLGFQGMQALAETGDHYHQLGNLSQFPFLGGLEPQLPLLQPQTVPGLLPFHGQDQAGKSTVKMEETSRGQYHLWGGAGGSSTGGGSDCGGWMMTDLSGFNSSL